MVLILESIKMLVYFLCVTTIGELFFYYPKRNIRYRNIALLIWSFLTAIIISNSHIVVQVVIHIVSVLAVLELWFKKSLKNYLTLYIGSIAVLSMLAVLINITFNEIVRFIHFNGIKEVFELLTYVLIFIATRIVGKYYEKKYNRGLVNIGTKYWLFFIGILFFDAVIIKVMGSYILDNVKAERRYIIIFLFWCVVNGLLIQLVLLINTLVTRNTHRDNENLAKQFLESQNEHYQYLEKKNMRRKNFDMISKII